MKTLRCGMTISKMECFASITKNSKIPFAHQTIMQTGFILLSKTFEITIDPLYSLNQSEELLQAIWNKEADVVAKGIEKVHEENTSIIAYNNENALSCIVSLALYTAKNYYTIVRELPSGKGYSDLVFIPRKKYEAKPAIVIELKWDKSVAGAIAQIKERNYISALEEYKGNVLLVGVNYDKESKNHQCVIESVSYGENN